MPVIDLHAHAVLEPAFGKAGSYGPELTEQGGPASFRVGDYVMKPSPYRGSVFMDVDKRIAGMDELAIDLQLLSPNPLSFFAGIEAEPATAFAEATNEAMAALVSQHPDRLLGSAQVPLQDVVAAQRVAERAAELGLRGVYASTNYPVPLDDASYDAFYQTLVALDLPLFIHPATNDGRSKAPDTRLHRFGLDLIVGYTYEETITAATMILGGVFERHPDLDVCISHGGGAIAYLAERFDSMARFGRRPTGFADQLRHFWFDAHMEPGPARDLLIGLVGTERMVYGTNFGGWDTPTEVDAFDASLTPNARRLLRLGTQGAASS
jgi:aminocarboxymuconate-semialdehyde decarboxylase